MGNESSSQSKSQQDEQESQAEQSKPWDYNEITSSDSEGRAIVVKSVRTSTQPESPHTWARKPRPRKQQQKKKKTDSTSQAKDTGIFDDNDDGDGTEKSTSVLPEAPAVTDDAEPVPTNSNETQIEADDSLLNEALPQSTPQEEQTSEHQKPSKAASKIPTGSKPLPNKPHLDKTRYPCPRAADYGCDKTFSTDSTAKRHLKTHTHQSELACSVCGKVYSHADKLKTHKLTHSRGEIDSSMAAHGTQQKDQEVEVDDGDADVTEPSEATEASIVDTRPHQEIQKLTGELAEVPESVPIENILNKSKTVSNNAGESSAQVSTTSASVFDEPVEAEVVAETPQPKSKLKRKRGPVDADRLAYVPIEASRKRRRKHSLSPPTSVSSEAEDSTATEKPRDPSAESTSASLSGISTAKIRKSGNLDGFAKTWTPGSQLYHPIHNPRSPRVKNHQPVQVRIAQSSQAGPSKLKTRTKDNKLDLTSRKQGSSQSALVRKSGEVVYTSPKGKRRAEEGVMYSSPPKNREHPNDSEDSEPTGLATTVARRTISKQGVRKRARSVDLDDVDEQSDPTWEAPSVDSGDKKPLLCEKCNRKFVTRAGLQKHMRTPDIHSNHGEGDGGLQKFSSLKGLKEHPKSANHDTGAGGKVRKGHFSSAEGRKLEKWKIDFCNFHDIDAATFNQMMTDTSRRNKTFHWPYRFVTKNEFLKEYYEVLPDRDKRSMARYRERNFQNIPTKQEWTEEDDEELIRLVKEHGQKWVEIGQFMARTQDSVSQRWRFKLQYKGKIHQGEWLKSEETKLKEAVAEVRRASGFSLDPYVDVPLSWESVSKKFKGHRTARQCSNKWRLMHHVRKRKDNKFVKPSEADVKPSTSSIAEATPSKLSQRLAGQTPLTTQQHSSHKKTNVSPKYVTESESNDESNLHVDESDDNNDNTESGAQLQDALETTQTSQSPGGSGAQKTSSSRDSLLSRVSQTGRDQSQSFVHAQANTSAVRVPNSLHRQQSQTNVLRSKSSVQQQPVAQSRNHVNKNHEQHSPPEEDPPGKDGLKEAHDVRDAIMADPLSSDHESESAHSASVSSSQRSQRKISEEESEASLSATDGEDEDEDEDDAEAEATSSSASNSDTLSESGSESSDQSSNEDRESDSMVTATQKDAFVRSLQSSNYNSPLASKGSRPVGGRKSSSRISLEQAYRGEAADESESESESDSDSGDLGDIMHH